MRDALNATGRPIVFSLCGWEPWYSNPDPSLGYKGGGEILNSSSLLKIFAMSKKRSFGSQARDKQKRHSKKTNAFVRVPGEPLAHRSR
jgi:hypothetical protein